MPENSMRPILGVSVHPDVTRETAANWVSWLARQGYGGLAVIGSTPKPFRDLNEWLPGFLRSMHTVVDEAKRAGVEVWILDEWGYPSGCACGQVLENPRFRAKKLHVYADMVLEAGRSVTLPVPERFVAAGAMPVNRFYFYHPAGAAEPVTPENGQIQYTAREKTRLVAVTWEYVSFVTHVMKDYKEGDPTIGTIDILDKAATRRFIECMHELYAPVIGDEFGKTVKGFFYDEPEIPYHFPYTEELPAYFEARCGYPLSSILPELMTYLGPEMGVTGGGDAFPRLRRMFDDYNDAWTAMLAENFYGELESWCHAHGLISVGHQDLDNHLMSLQTVSGDFFRNSARNDHPGVDVIWDNIFPGRFTDFPRYAGSVKRALGKKGAMSETFAEMGPSMYPDLMRYDMEQQLLRGIDQFFFLAAPMEPQTGGLPSPFRMDDPNNIAFARAVNDRIERTCKWCNVGEPGAKIAIYVPMRDVAFDERCNNPHLLNGCPLPWERVERLAELLAYAPIDFDYAWEEGLDTLYARGIRTLLLPGRASLGEAAKARLREFARLGGEIVSVWQPCTELESRFEPVAEDWVAGVSSGVRLSAPEKRVGLLTRDTKEGRVYLLLNESNLRFPASLAFDGPGALEEMDARDGAWLAPRERAVELEFAPRELKVFRVNPALSPLPRAEKRAEAEIADWTLVKPDGTRAALCALRDWPSLGFGDYSGWMRYESAFDWAGGDALIDLGDLRYGARVEVDGATYDLPFSPHRLRLPLPAGRHEIAVEVLNTSANALFSGDDDGRANFTGGYWRLYQYERSYQKCGLLGPVTVTRA